VRLFFQRLYLLYTAFWFITTFLLLLPFFFLFISIRFRPGIVLVNRVWCFLFFPLSFLSVRKVGTLPKIPGGAVVVANHASYLDIPVLTDVLGRDHSFLGKSSLNKVPLFGYMYRNLHILVDRSDKRSKQRSLQEARHRLDTNRWVVFFPEGTIRSEIQPGIGDLKDGAFFLAIQAQVPIIPITLPYNWYIFPDEGQLIARHRHPVAVIHPPIPTEGLTEADSARLKAEVARIFTQDLETYNAQNGRKHHQ
jgi:1-acyl-sn-glycerol-3-phosphate acyltransferase